MDEIGPRRAESRAVPSVDLEPEAASLRDASAIVAKADEDEAVAAEARIRYRAEGIPPLEPDEAIRALLHEDEHPLAVRRSVVLDRREPPQNPQSHGLGGDLYVTSRRLVLVGRRSVAFDLADITDAVDAGERLQLILRDGTGVSLDVDQPRLLRVQIAAARAATRTGEGAPGG